jgi:hypothetical protein
MIKYLVYSFVFIVGLFAANSLQAQNFYDTNTIQDIEIYFNFSNWDYRLDTAKMGSDEFLMADWIKINGVQLDSVGVKYKGNSSFDSTYGKNPIRIELDEYNDQNYLGVKDIKLSNGYSDPSMIREVLAYSLLGNYMHCPQANFAKVTINGNYIGLYSSAESINEKFCSDHFYSQTNTFVKCNPTGAASPATKSNYRYTVADSSNYMTFYEMKSTTGWNELVNLCNVATNSANTLEQVMDIDRAMWMLAFNTICINLDSYNGVFSQNHYAYKDGTGRFNPIIWDLNMCFGAFPYAGVGAASFGVQNNNQMQQFALDYHASDPNWPLIVAVQNNPSWKKRYLAHCKTIWSEMIQSGAYLTLANQYYTLVNTAAMADMNMFFTTTQFQQALDSAYTFSGYSVPGIKTLMEGRKNYLAALPIFTTTAPTIGVPVFSVSSPTVGATITLTTVVTNATAASVTLGYRFDRKQKFEKITLFDDGAHGDGAAGDNNYGISMVFSGADMEYYLYAENDSIGTFLPARAEYEYFHQYASSVQPTSGSLVINEVLAENVGGERDEYNDTEDWVELYNNSNDVLDLSSTYLSNTPSQLLRWKFPNHTYLLPHSYLTIWADDDSLQQIFHTNFNLSKDTGKLFLANNAATILDSVSFTNQTQNVSYGRYPNGVGSFITMGTTYGYENNNWALSVNNVQHNKFHFYPNPANSNVYLTWQPQDGWLQLRIYNTTGALVAKKLVNGSAGQVQISVQDLTNGLYILQLGNHREKLHVHH